MEHDIAEHFLQTMPWHGLKQHMGDLIGDSVRVLVHRRCKLPEPDDVDFSTIPHLDTLL
ncbi:hypothetical protein [Paenibacillus donghaensis]|uniref:hypothetical protein n=1 Tax=Paenibacillus donghaensis TaxID=414771 RepID=UPI0012FD2919|nr:hypothetical protein [Paenibacillus donghaensis]